MLATGSVYLEKVKIWSGVTNTLQTDLYKNIKSCSACHAIKVIRCLAKNIIIFRCASISWIHVGESVSESFMFLRFCQILGIFSGCAQDMFKVCSECVQSVFRVCSECVQSVFSVGSGLVVKLGCQ